MRMRSARSDLGLAKPISPTLQTVLPVPTRRSRRTPRKSSWFSTTGMRLLMAPSLRTPHGWDLHLDGRALAQGRLNPDASNVHLHDLLGDGEPKASAALGLGVRIVDLMELFEDARRQCRAPYRPR
jgi:hypothetical protein